MIPQDQRLSIGVAARCESDEQDCSDFMRNIIQMYGLVITDDTLHYYPVRDAAASPADN
jgi:hypothetical protein